MTFTLESTPDGIDLVVGSDWSDEAAQALHDGRADGLILNYVLGFRERNLEFLTGMPIRRLQILARTITDLSPVYSLAEWLATLRVQSDPRAVIELERLPHLRTLSASWEQVQGSIRYAAGLRHMCLLGYTERDLEPLTAADALESLVLKDHPRLRCLDGVEALPGLADLSVHLAKDLSDISALKRVPSRSLKTLQLPSCRMVSDIAPVAACPSLSFFELSEGSTLPTLAALSNLQQLERLYLYGSTDVSDGDLSGIAALPRLRDFRMQSRRSYLPSVKEIQGAIANRA